MFLPKSYQWLRGTSAYQKNQRFVFLNSIQKLCQLPDVEPIFKFSGWIKLMFLLSILVSVKKNIIAHYRLPLLKTRAQERSKVFVNLKKTEMINLWHFARHNTWRIDLNGVCTCQTYPLPRNVCRNFLSDGVYWFLLNISVWVQTPRTALCLTLLHYMGRYAILSSKYWLQTRRWNMERVNFLWKDRINNILE